MMIIISLLVGGAAGYVVGQKQGESKAMMAASSGTNPASPYPEATTAVTTNPVQPAQETSMMDQMTISMMAQNNSEQSGTATLSEENGEVKVVLSLKGGSFTDPQPAHIHVGSCPTPGAVQFPLTDVVNGTSETMIKTTLAELKAKGPFAVNVHKSAADVKTYTSCGDIK